MNEVAKYACPCCGNLTLERRPPGTYGLCPVCFWEDDDVQYYDPAYEGGANAVSLFEARSNYAQFQASEARFWGKVRRPRADEVPPPS
jgi:hypothetical protein